MTKKLSPEEKEARKVARVAKNTSPAEAPKAPLKKLPMIEEQEVVVQLGQLSASIDWKHRGLQEQLQGWAARFSERYQLDVDHPAIAVEQAWPTAYATYKIDRDGYGLRNKITINELHLERPQWAILRTLLHEMLHEWQHQFGTPSIMVCHNKEMREKATEFGLIISDEGFTQHRKGAFVSLLREFNVEVPDEDLSKPIDAQGRPVGKCNVTVKKLGKDGKPKSNYTLKKWSCACTNVRCNVDLEATCGKCKMPFAKQEPPVQAVKGGQTQSS